MLPLIMAAMSLLQGQQKKADEEKQAGMYQYGGDGAPPPAEGEKGGGMAGNLLGSLGDMGGGKKKKPVEPGKPPDPNDPAPDGGGLSNGTTNLLDSQFGAPGSLTDKDLLNDI